VDDIRVSRMDRAAALAVVGWRYPPPYDFYTLSDDPAATAAFLADAESGYFQLRDGAGQLVAFCCYGEEARVPGGDYDAPALDFGIGVRPDLVGRGQGMRYLVPVLRFGATAHRPQLLRLTVAAFNQRAIRLYRRAGFQEASRFTSRFASQAYLIMTLPVEALP
jgi:[ribosomal protein S18]-alanine N-acetyltransferase